MTPVAMALALVSLAAAIAVGWVGRKVRRVAVETEARGAEIERLLEGRARLMRGITHDLRSPLQIIAGHAGLLRDGVVGPLTEAQIRSVDHIRHGAWSLLALIGDLSDMWYAESGQIVVRQEPTDFGRLLRDLGDGYRPLVEAAGLRLDVRSATTLPVVMTDPFRVRQVLSNLLSNATKYTPSGGRVTVSAKPVTAAVGATRARWVSVDVGDTGNGIPADKLETIFEEFVRLDPEVQPGSGLGLAISRRVARLLGGEITVVSTVGRGTTFTLWLPLRRLPPPPLSGVQRRPLGDRQPAMNAPAAPVDALQHAHAVRRGGESTEEAV